MNDEKIYFTVGNRRIYLRLSQLSHLITDIFSDPDTNNSSGTMLKLFLHNNAEEEKREAEQQFIREQNKIDSDLT